MVSKELCYGMAATFRDTEVVRAYGEMVEV